MTKLPQILVLVAGLVACSGEDSGDPMTGPSAPDAGTLADASGPVVDAMAAVDAQPAGTLCAAKDAPVQLGYTCFLEWSQCSDQSSYGVDCRIQNLAGNIFSLCDCKENGTEGAQFISSSLCDSTTWEAAETIVNENCGWDLR